MNFIKNKKGFTLIEVLIAASLFAVVTTMTTMILFDIITTEKRTSILSAVYDDARVVMEQITTMIHENAIDYDEYYSMNVIQNDSQAYGMYHGVYTSRFYDPGLTYNNSGEGSQGTNPANLGVECSDVGWDETNPISGCIVVYKNSKDKNTGKNPFEGHVVEEEGTGNAFCDENIDEEVEDCDKNSSKDLLPPKNMDELFLLSPDGTRKTIIAKMLTYIGSLDFSIGLLELEGIDHDQNGMVDLFTCATNYSCNSPAPIGTYLVKKMNYLFPGIAAEGAIPDSISISTRAGKEGFIPITPFRSTVTSLKFIITPVDDPYKAYAETAMQTHPSVTILLTMEPSAAEKSRYPGQTPPPIYIQRTVTAGVHGKVESYPPTNDLRWINALIPST